MIRHFKKFGNFFSIRDIQMINFYPPTPYSFTPFLVRHSCSIWSQNTWCFEINKISNYILYTWLVTSETLDSKYSWFLCFDNDSYLQWKGIKIGKSSSSCLGAPLSTFQITIVGYCSNENRNRLVKNLKHIFAFAVCFF